MNDSLAELIPMKQSPLIFIVYIHRVAHTAWGKDPGSLAWGKFRIWKPRYANTWEYSGWRSGAREGSMIVWVLFWTGTWTGIIDNS